MKLSRCNVDKHEKTPENVSVKQICAKKFLSVSLGINSTNKLVFLVIREDNLRTLVL